MAVGLLIIFNSKSLSVESFKIIFQPELIAFKFLSQSVFARFSFSVSMCLKNGY